MFGDVTCVRCKSIDHCQVMYMYYLLGYRILGQCEQRMKSLMKLIEDSPDKRIYRRHFDENEDLHVYYKDILGPRLLLEVNRVRAIVTRTMLILNAHMTLFVYFRQRIRSSCLLMVMLISDPILSVC
jgi:hypothetical protein